jgi:trehalose utilization protein
MPIRVTVWNENRHEQAHAHIRALYPTGIHGAIAAALAERGDVAVTTATLDEPEHGLTVERLAATDVLYWWGHAAHGEVADAVVERVVERVWQGMGLVVLHSGHFSKPFKRLMGSPCALKWREAGETERLWVVARGHALAAGLPDHFELAEEEMYGEPFSVPEPLETVFISWFAGGEVFRSGLTYQRGQGKIFYFRPGHESYPTYHDPNVRRVLQNAAGWAHTPLPAWTGVTRAPNVPADQAPEPLTARGNRLHRDGDEGLR